MMSDETINSYILTCGDDGFEFKRYPDVHYTILRWQVPVMVGTVFVDVHAMTGEDFRRANAALRIQKPHHGMDVWCEFEMEQWNLNVLLGYENFPVTWQISTVPVMDTSALPRSVRGDLKIQRIDTAVIFYGYNEGEMMCSFSNVQWLGFHRVLDQLRQMQVRRSEDDGIRE